MVLIDSEEVLVIDCFELVKMDPVPWFRTFCAENEYISWDYQEKKWRTAAFDGIAGFYISNYYKKKCPIVPAHAKDRDTIIGFMRAWLKRHDVKDICSEYEEYIYLYQKTIRQWNLEDKHRAIINRIDSRMELFGDIPEDYPVFAEKEVMDNHNYFFYSKKEKWAYCTRCRHTFEIRKDGIWHKTLPLWNKNTVIKHNWEYMCPYCNKPIMAKSAGMSRQSLNEVEWSVLVQTHGDIVLSRYFRHTKDYRKDFRHPDITITELYRTVLTPAGEEEYEISTYPHTGKIRWCVAKNHSWYWNPSEFTCPQTAVLYNKDFSIIKDTYLKYSCVEIYLDKIYPQKEYKGAWDLDRYFVFYRKHPYIEQMLKIGWYRMVMQLMGVEERYIKEDFVNGRSITESCKISRQQFLTIKEASSNPDIDYLRIMHAADKRGVNLNVRELEELHDIKSLGHRTPYNAYLDVMKYTSIFKLKKYFRAQGIHRIEDYRDYISWLEELGSDMKNEFNLFPKNFMQRHDETMEVLLKARDKEYRKNLERFNKILKKKRKEDPEKLEAEGLFIRLPEKVEELKKEGEALHHCVGTYIDKVINGETTIFFIRRTAEPEKPYYTLEWKDNAVAQCRGFRNCDMTPEIKAFTDVFSQQMLQAKAN